MPSYKLIYFNARARGEAARLLFKVAEVDFEDKRIDYSEWPEFKAKTPFGKLPILEVDGKQLTESKAIYRFLAREFGYHGQSNWESSHIDCVLDMLEDLHTGAVIKIIMSEGEEKEKHIAEYKTNIHATLSNLEKKLKENNDGNGYFVGDKMTVADLCLFCELNFVSALSGDKEATKEFSKLEALKHRVGSNAIIAAWVASSPVTPL